MPVRHGRVPGRDFHLRVTFDVRAHLIRIEVADASASPPLLAPATAAGPDDETGRGLLLVEALAVRWGTVPRDPVGKTVGGGSGGPARLLTVVRRHCPSGRRAGPDPARGA